MIGPYYIYWHYTQGLAELIKNFWNFVIFELHFFSVTDLLRTLFSPFQRLKENYGGNITDLENILSTFVVNIIMRIIGLLVRTFILVFAFVSLTLTFLLFPLIIIFWLVLPVLLLILMTGAIWAYIKYRIRI